MLLSHSPLCFFLVTGTAILLSTTTTSVEAVTHYVRKTGRDPLMVTECSLDAPCATIQTAIDIAEAGDIIDVGPGEFTENLRLGSPAEPDTKSEITIIGSTEDPRYPTAIISAGGVMVEVERPKDVAADIVVDVWSSNVKLQSLHIIHPIMPSSTNNSGKSGGMMGDGISGGAASARMDGDSVLVQVAVKRDIGVYVGPPGLGFQMKNCNIYRQRSGEPTRPGSRGILVSQATDTFIESNTFKGFYEDHIHIPSSSTTIVNNRVEGATRLGIVLIQESADSMLMDNLVMNNIVKGSGGDGIQVQSDHNTIQENSIIDNGGAAIKICGIAQDVDCVLPFDQWSDATFNYIIYNNITDDNIGGNIVDNGVDTQYPPEEDVESDGQDEPSDGSVLNTQDGAMSIISTKMTSQLFFIAATASSLLDFI